MSAIPPSRVAVRRLPACAVPVLAAVLATLLATPAAADLPDHPRLQQLPEPSWVDELSPRLAEESPPASGVGVTYLLVDRQIHLPPQGPASRFHRYVYRLDARSALESWSSWEVDFDPSYESLAFHRLEVWRDGRWDDRLAESRSSLLQREADLDRQLYDQRLTLVSVLDDVRVGDVVRVSYTITGENPVFGGRYHGDYTLAWSVPIARSHLRLLAGPGRRPRHRLFATSVEPHRRRADGWTETVWDLRQLEALEAESNTPAEWVTFPFVQITEYPDWRSVVDWALPLYAPTAPPPPEIIAAADRVRAQRRDPLARVVAARNWVQDEIRYFAVVLGEHSHAPHRPPEILRRRYGDCKDKSVLLIQLLQALGIEAWPSFVNTDWRRGIADRLPSPGAFNHVIVAARVGDRTVWMDPTLTHQGSGADALWVPRYELTLELRPEVEGLSELDPEQSHPGVTRAAYEYHLETEGEVSQATVTTHFEGRGAENMREMLEGTTADDLLDSYVDFYSAGSLEVEPRGELEISDDRDSNRLTITEHYDLRYEAEADDSRFFSTLALLMETDLGIPDDLERHAPYALPHPLQREETVRLHTREPWDLERVDAEERNPWFELTAVSRPLADGLEIAYELRTLAAAVPADQLPNYVEAVESMHDQLGYSVWTEVAEAQAAGKGLRTRLAIAGVGIASMSLILLALVVLVLLVLWGLGVIG